MFMHGLSFSFYGVNVRKYEKISQLQKSINLQCRVRAFDLARSQTSIHQDIN